MCVAFDITVDWPFGVKAGSRMVAHLPGDPGSISGPRPLVCGSQCVDDPGKCSSNEITAMPLEVPLLIDLSGSN